MKYTLMQERGFIWNTGLPPSSGLIQYCDGGKRGSENSTVKPTFSLSFNVCIFDITGQFSATNISNISKIILSRPLQGLRVVDASNSKPDLLGGK